MLEALNIHSHVHKERQPVAAPCSLAEEVGLGTHPRSAVSSAARRLVADAWSVASSAAVVVASCLASDAAGIVHLV